MKYGGCGLFAFLKDYVAQMAGKRASAVDFFRILRRHTRADLAISFPRISNIRIRMPVVINGEWSMVNKEKHRFGVKYLRSNCYGFWISGH